MNISMAVARITNNREYSTATVCYAIQAWLWRRGLGLFFLTLLAFRLFLISSHAWHASEARLIALCKRPLSTIIDTFTASCNIYCKIYHLDLYCVTSVPSALRPRAPGLLNERDYNFYLCTGPIEKVSVKVLICFLLRDVIKTFHTD